MQTRAAERSNSAFVVPIRRVERPVLRLICFPFGGAGAAAYWDWQEWLPADVELCAIRLAGRESRFLEPFDDSADLVIEALHAEARRLPVAPTVYFGHSMGAGLACQLIARQAAAREALPVLLIASGRHPPRDAAEGEWGLSSDAALLEHVDTLGGLPREIRENESFLRIYLARLRADYLLNDSIPSSVAPFDVPITVINGEQDPLISPDKIAGWQTYTRRAFRALWMSGHHFFLNQHRERFSAVIREELAGVRKARDVHNGSHLA